MSTSAVIPPMGGWTRRQLIEIADRRTERRGSKVLDLDQEFILALQEFCMDARWPWRRKSTWLQTFAGLGKYDLTQAGLYLPANAPAQATLNIQNGARAGGVTILTFADATSLPAAPGTIYILSATDPTFNGALVLTARDGTTATGNQAGADASFGGTVGSDLASALPFPAIQGAGINDLQQFAERGVKLYTTPGDISKWCELEPLFDRDEQDAALDAVQQGRPGYYFMEPGAFLSFVLTPIPDATYRVRIAYWAIPNIAPDAAPEAIPLVPAFLQHVLLARLEARIFRFTLGEGAAKYQASMGEYNALVAKYKTWEDFTPGQVKEWKDHSNEAIQSTH
jgi:hypothetical protein